MWSFGKRTFQACRALFLTGQFSDWVGGGGGGFVGDIQLGNALYCDVSSRETCSRQMLRLARAQFWSEESVGNELNVLLVFRVTPFKIDQNKNQNRSIDKVRKLGNERRYIYKDPRQDSDQRNISYTRYPKKCFTQTYRDLYGTPCWSSPGWAPTWRTETKRNICNWVLLQKREFILRETHKIFLIHELFR